MGKESYINRDISETMTSSNVSIEVPGDETVLNPNAPAFMPSHSNERSLFLTFSNGFPLTEAQIFNYFNE